MIGSSALSGPVVTWLDASLKGPAPTENSVAKWIPIRLAAVVGLGTTTTCESILSVFQVFVTMALCTVRRALLSCNLNKCTQLASHIPTSYDSDKLLADTRAMPRLAFRAALIVPTSLISVQMGLDLYRSLTPEAGEGLTASKEISCMNYLTHGIQRRVSRCSRLLYRWTRRHPLLATTLLCTTAVATRQLRKYTLVKPKKPRPPLLLTALPKSPEPTLDPPIDRSDHLEPSLDSADDRWLVLPDSIQYYVDAIESLEGTWTFFCMQAAVVTTVGAILLYNLKNRVSIELRLMFLTKTIEFEDALGVATGTRHLDVEEVYKHARLQGLPPSRDKGREDYRKKIQQLALSFKNPDNSLNQDAIKRHLDELDQEAATLPYDVRRIWDSAKYRS